MVKLTQINYNQQLSPRISPVVPSLYKGFLSKPVIFWPVSPPAFFCSLCIMGVSSSSNIRCAGPSRSSNCPEPIAHIKIHTITPSSTRDKGMSRYRISMVYPELVLPEANRNALITTINELSDMPIAAIQGDTYPVAAAGIAHIL